MEPSIRFLRRKKRNSSYDCLFWKTNMRGDFHREIRLSRPLLDQPAASLLLLRPTGEDSSFAGNAMEMARRARELEPDSAWAALHLARAHHRLRQYEEAMEVLDAIPSQKSKPLTAMASTLRAMTTFQLGNKQDAVEHLEQARELNRVLASQIEANWNHPRNHPNRHWHNVPICQLFLEEAEVLINNE